MGCFRLRRSILLLPGVPGTGLSYIDGGPLAQPQATLTDAGAARIPTDDKQLPKDRAWRGWLEIALAVAIMVVVIQWAV
jgi:hypothetical protein